MALREGVDPQRLGSFGVSMGGIASTMVAAVEPRLRVHVIALAGGGIPQIVATSHDRQLTKPLANYLQRNHLDRATLYRLMRNAVTTDPIRLAPYVDRENLFMLIALCDRTIGTANALRLWRALGQPETVFMTAGHYTAYLYLLYMKHAALRFFQRHLSAENPLR